MLRTIVGLVFVVLGICGIISWWSDFGLALRGLVPFVLLVVGLVSIGAGLVNESLVKDSAKDSQDTE